MRGTWWLDCNPSTFVARTEQFRARAHVHALGSPILNRPCAIYHHRDGTWKYKALSRLLAEKPYFILQLCFYLRTDKTNTFWLMLPHGLRTSGTHPALHQRGKVGGISSAARFAAGIRQSWNLRQGLAFELPTLSRPWTISQ